MKFDFLKKKDIHKNAIVSIVDGNVIPLENVKDVAFSQRLLGDGVAIIPKQEVVVAPCDGEITMLYPSLHAFGITNHEGLEILVHIGVDTVRLKGKGFRKYVNNGDKVKAGDKIISFDSTYLLDPDLDFTTMILFPGCDKKITKVLKGYVRKGKDIVVTYE